MSIVQTRKVNGLKGAYLQPIKYGQNESGEYSLLRWEGTYNEVRANIPFVLQMGGVYEFSESFTGGKCALEARIPRNYYNGEIPVDVWEFFSQVAEKDLLSSDNATVAGAGSDNIDRIRNLLQNPPGPDDSPVDSTDFLDDEDNSASDALSIYELMASGVSAIRVNVPTLRNTTTVSTVYALQISLSNIGRIISTGSLNADGVPAGTVGLLPNQTSARPGFVYGWYKKHPTVRAGARQKVQVEREWEYGLWSTVLYGNAL